ncbi:MAG: hypothetical protein ACK55I_21410, partial [bacterium]
MDGSAGSLAVRVPLQRIHDPAELQVRPAVVVVELHLQDEPPVLARAERVEAECRIQHALEHH